jgi:hypothetical protein
MRRVVFRAGAPSLPAISAAIAAVLVLAGALVWLWPYLTRERQSVAGVPAPAALATATWLVLEPHRDACMSSVTVDPSSRFAEFQLRASKSMPIPPVQLLLSAPGYRAAGQSANRNAQGSVELPIATPRRSVIATACFINRGGTAVLLEGTTEARTITRSELQIAGEAIRADIALTFLDRPRSLLDRLGEVFGHVSNLTDRLVPEWLIWVLAISVAVGVPLAMLAALYVALREDEATAGN